MKYYQSQARPDPYFVRYTDRALSGFINRGTQTYKAAKRLRSLLVAEGATIHVEIYRRANIRQLEPGLWQFTIQSEKAEFQRQEKQHESEADHA